MFCRHCGVSISDNSKFCPKCGTPVIGNDIAKADNSEVSTPVINDADDNISTENMAERFKSMADDFQTQAMAKGAVAVKVKNESSENSNVTGAPKAEVPRSTSVVKKIKTGSGRNYIKKSFILSCATVAVGVVGIWLIPQYANDLIFNLISQNTADPQTAVMTQLAIDPNSDRLLRKKLSLAKSYASKEEYGAAIALFEELEYKQVDSAGDDIDSLLEENCSKLTADAQIRYAYCQAFTISDDSLSHKCRNAICLSAAQLAYENHDIDSFKSNINKINTVYSYDESTYTDLVYKCAIEEFNSENYAEAIEIFTKVKSYSNASEYINKSAYMQGEKLMEQQNYIDAVTYYKKAGNYNDSSEKIKECNYLYAEKLYDQEQYENAAIYYSKASGYKNSSERAKYCKYYLGIDSYNHSDYETAKKWFDQIKGFENTDSYLSYINYNIKYTGWYIYAWTCDDYFYEKTRFSTYDNINININIYNEYKTNETVKIRTVMVDNSGNTSTNYRDVKAGDSFYVTITYNSPYWVTATNATFYVYLDETNELLGSYPITLW